MSAPTSDARDRLAQATSRLGRALLRLNAALARVEEREARIEELFAAWDKSWDARRNQILRWLAAIDEEADQLPETPPPLTLVRMSADADETTSMIEA